jgi:putative spermidine/putrescine transport system ATP-binding protein
MSDTVLTLENVSKNFGPVVAANDINIEVGQTEFFALLGPSGSGKTTMLRMIAGLEKPDRGRIVIGGKDITGEPPYRRGIGMVFQDFLLFPHKTVSENITFPLKMQHASSEVKSQNLDWVCNLVRLKGLEERYPHQLSGGQKQRVALARALVSRPSLLLLDEPLANLDRELRKEMEVEIRRFQIELGIPFVYVTHNQEEALTMSDRMAVMRDGKMEQVGEKFSLYHDPSSRFVASFLGAPNAFEGKVVAVSDGVVEIDWLGHPIKARAHGNLKTGDNAVCYVKSENINFKKGEGPLTGTLRDIIFKGQYADFLISLGEGREITASAAPQSELKSTATLHVDWNLESADAFPSGG